MGKSLYSLTQKHQESSRPCWDNIQPRRQLRPSEAPKQQLRLHQIFKLLSQAVEVLVSVLEVTHSLFGRAQGLILVDTLPPHDPIRPTHIQVGNDALPAELPITPLGKFAAITSSGGIDPKMRTS